MFSHIKETISAFKRLVGSSSMHKHEDINVQLDRYGHVVGVWYKNIALPFIETEVDDNKADELSSFYKQTMPIIIGMDIDVETC